MRFAEVRLPAPDLAAQRVFYVDRLGLPPLDETADAVAVAAGATRLVFERSRSRGFDTAGAQHLAFNIPENKLAAAKAWLAGRATLLTKDGADEFAAAPSWNADMLYLRDPAGHILEFIARHNLPNATPGAFGPGDVLAVSEVGLPVDDVPAAVAWLAATLEAEPWGDQEPGFAPVGDEGGLLIVVRRGRPWFPTATPAAAAPLAVTVRGAVAASHRLPGLPYRFAVAPDRP